jgi:hypothetical protein
MALKEKKDVFGNHTSTRHKSIHGETHGYFEDISQPDMLGNNYTVKTSKEYQTVEDVKNEFKEAEEDFPLYKGVDLREPLRNWIEKLIAEDKKESPETFPAHEEEVPKHLKDIDYAAAFKESITGYKESDGKLEYELDWDFITMMAERMAVNKSKYGKGNWQKPINIEGLKQSLFRHVIEIMKGNYDDNEEGDLGHLIAASLNSMFIVYQEKLKQKEELLNQLRR